MSAGERAASEGRMDLFRACPPSCSGSHSHSHDLPQFRSHLRFRPSSHSRPHARAAGFTFLELILVLAVIACLFAIGMPSLRGLTPRYRLRSAARALGTTLEQTRLSAMGRGLWMGIHYVITPGSRDDSDSSYFQVIPAAPQDSPDQPIQERKPLSKQELPTGVRIAKILLSDNQVFDRGSLDILFSPMGNAGSHIVVLEESEGQTFSLKMSSITGVIEFIEGADVAFQHFTE